MKVKDLIAILATKDQETQVLSEGGYLGFGGAEGRDVEVGEIRVEDEEQAEASGLPVGTLEYIVLS
jgi:hypothetical protein